MNVKEYEVEFDRLSQFTSALVADEKSRSCHFAKGLENNIRRALVSFLWLSYAKVVDIAKDLKITWQET